MSEQDQQFAALIELHRGLARQGPGDTAFSRDMLSRLPALPRPPRIADLGCGSGVATLMLAEHFGTTVRAVDLARALLDDLARRADASGLRDRVEIIEADMGNLPWSPASLDLLWSEGAAYQLTFEGALRAWRPLLETGGCAVISELSWFVDDPPAPARDFWRNACPAIAGEEENKRKAEAAGFRVLGTHRLPTQAWWDNYYLPLRRRIAILAPAADPVLAGVIAETEAEMALFERHHDAYGYTFYLLEAR